MSSGSRGASDAAHQGLEHGVGEHEDDTDEGHPHEAERTGVHVGRHAEQRQEAGREQISGGA